jgi:succinoglycan biosynthesis transport protein ExoP
VTPAYPGKLPLLDQQIADLQRQLTAAVKATQNTNSSTLPAQANLEQSYQQALIQLATTQRRLADAVALKNEASAAMTPLVETGSTYDQIAREAQEADANYSGLEAALVSARLRESQTNSDIQITQSAVAPDAPAKPNPSLNMLMGGLLGLLVSLAAVFIIEQTDRRVRTEDQVERLGSGPILGALPRLSRAALAQLDRKQLPIPVAESYSLAGANLLRVLGSPQPGNGRIVMVTSAQAGEGKSLTAAELARSLARSGKHVILVDVDMRRPALNTLFDDAPEEGLVEVLSGKSLLDDALTASETPNLSVLFNNASRVNSADIIVSPHMTNFLQMVRNRAEIIVLDAPSCTVVDPLLLAPSVDYVLQVIDLGRANEDAVNSTSSVLSGLAPLGLFINRTNKRNAPAYEVARSFAATLAPPALAGGSAASPFSPDHTLMMFRNTSGYTPGTLDGASDPLANDRQDAHDLTIPLKNREDH